MAVCFSEEEDYRWLSNIEKKNRKHATVCCKNFIAIFLPI